MFTVCTLPAHLTVICVQAHAASFDATLVRPLVVPSFSSSTVMQLNDSGSSHNVALPYSADVDDSWFDFVIGSWRGQEDAVPVGCYQHNVVSWIEDEMAWLWRWTPTLSLRLSFMSRRGLATWHELSTCQELRLHISTTEAFRVALLLGFVEYAHPLQHDARWVIFTDGAAELLPEGRVATWAFAVLERVGASFQFAGARSGKVYEVDCHP